MDETSYLPSAKTLKGFSMKKEVSRKKRCKAFFGGRRLWTMSLLEGTSIDETF